MWATLDLVTITISICFGRPEKQRLTLTCLKGRYCHKDAILARSRRIVTANHQVLMDWVASEPHLSVVEPEGGTTALVYYDYPVDSYEFCTRMVQETGALVTPGDCFEEPRSMRLGYAYSDNPEALREGLGAISDFCRIVEREQERL